MNRAAYTALVEQGYNRIPFVRQILADLDTPLSTYLKVGQGRYTYLFESVQGGEKWGRYSIIGLPARTVLSVTGRQLLVTQDGAPQEAFESNDPLGAVEAFRQRYRPAPLNVDGLRFDGGLVGYFGYDAVGYIEPKLAGRPQPDPLGTPDILLMLSEQVIVFDNLNGVLSIIVYADPDQPQAFDRAHERLAQLTAQLRAPLALYCDEPPAGEVDEADFVSGFTRQGYEAAVERCRDYIRAGDAMQIALSQRLSIPFAAKPLDVYRALRSLNPSPYLYFLDMGAFQIVGSSPEILVRLDAGQVTVRPIAGTRPRGAGDAQDLALERELLADPKELAEHLMLIDLGRNDVGRVAEFGSVRVTERMVVERYSHVMHLVSNVVGTLRAGLSAMDVLRATFPAGTLAGAPKIRAMEIIRELEPVKRGIYAGAVGYWGFGGHMDMAIAIRTAVIQDRQLHVQAGAGIVYDSQPDKEWQETMNKARTIFRAAAAACRGVDGVAAQDVGDPG